MKHSVLLRGQQKQQQNVLTGSMALKRCVINRAPAAMPNSPSDKLAIEWPTIRLSHHNMSYSICVFTVLCLIFRSPCQK